MVFAGPRFQIVGNIAQLPLAKCVNLDTILIMAIALSVLLVAAIVSQLGIMSARLAKMDTI